MTPTPTKFLTRLISLVEQELLAEESSSSLLLSNSPINLLQRSGLALTNLTPTVSTGLGGKVLVELKRSLAWHREEKFPPHDFRVGDLARIRTGAGGSSDPKGGKNSSASGATTKKGKSSSNNVDEGGIDGVVYKVGEFKIVLALDDDQAKDDLSDELSEKVTILKVSNPSTFTRQIFFLRQAIRRFEQVDNAAPSSLLSVLLGLSKPSLADSLPIKDDDDGGREGKGDIRYFDEKLNESQKEAVEFALKSNEVAAIWGPPGTGKTQTLVELIRQLVLTFNLRVLVCGASNLSVDNILARLSIPPPLPTDSKSKPCPPIPLTRLGHPARVLSSLTCHTLDSQSQQTDQVGLVEDIKRDLDELQIELNSKDRKVRPKGSERKKKWDEVKELRKDMRKRMGGVTEEVLGKAKVVLATTHGAGGKALDKHEFDVVIIDEAAQATEPACWIPIMRGKKLILAGDHLQLPPTLKSISSSQTSSSSRLPSSTGPRPLGLSKSLETTLFSRLLSLHGPDLRRMLKVQYRFNQKINEFPSKMLYDGQLVPDTSVVERKLGDVIVEEDVGKHDEDLNEPVVFIDTAGLAMYERSGEGGGYGSDSKSNENEADIVLNYVKFLIECGVPPTSISLISPYSSQVLLLSSLIAPLYPEIEVGSIDSNQGRENDAVIISLVRSNEEGEIGFLKESRRLNVAMSRPRRQLVVVGDSETLRKGGGGEVKSKGKGKGKEAKKDGQKGKKVVKEERDVAIESTDGNEDADSSEEVDSEENDTKEGSKEQRIGGAGYLKSWMDWLEENAYVRVP